MMASAYFQRNVYLFFDISLLNFVKFYMEFRGSKHIVLEKKSSIRCVWK